MRAISRPLAAAPPLVDLADAGNPLLWTRGDRGCVGIGETLRLTFSGPDRFAEASDAWRAIGANAEVDDPVRMPGSGLVALGAFAFDDHSGEQSVLIVPRILVARHRDQWWITETVDLASEPASNADPADPELPAARPRGEWAGVEFAAAEGSIDAYIAGVREATRRIDAGGIEKIVLARQVRGEVPAGSDLRFPLERLADRYLDCWTFAVDGLIGASPETLVRSTSGAVSARVLAGTRARHADRPQRDAQARDELLTSTKEQHEHAFAVQSVVTALSPHVRDLRTSEEPFPLRLPNVWHLATDLGATLHEQSSAIELVGALHPTAAVAGTPKSVSIAQIAELEPFDRGLYSGAVGWIDAAGDGEWVIALRCGRLGAADPDTGARPFVATAGGGIVAGSDPEHELGETVSKLRPITEAFAR
nr:isochorismate synthase [Leucobacter edaphi]